MGLIIIINTSWYLMSAGCAKWPTWVFSPKPGGKRSECLPFHGHTQPQRAERVCPGAQGVRGLRGL